VVDAGSGTELALRTARNDVRRDGPYPHFDVPRLWDFICGSLAELAREAPFDAVSVAAHGAAGVLLSGSRDADPDGDGVALPALDYEFSGPDEVAAEYDAVRPPFAESLAARLPGGLNLGAQIFWQQRRFPAVFEDAAYVTYPQYWAWRLTGVAACDVTSIGCHTDLWNPTGRRFSSMVDRLGWRELFAPLRSPFDALGPVRPAPARRLGLPEGMPVHCGIHDSNASLLPHLLLREPPFAVVSTGTWVIVLAVGGSTERLDPRRDGLAYVNAFGDPVPGARFMGGREFELLTARTAAEPTAAELGRVLADGIMVLPTFVPGVGPFPHGQGRWTHDPAALAPGERAAAASLYLALVTAECLAIAGAAGPVIIEGPFAANPIFGQALAAVCGGPVLISAERTGTTRGAALLARPGRKAPARQAEVAPLRDPPLPGYIAAWRRAARG